MKENLDRFDTSDYPADNIFGMPLANKKIPGLMKDECNGRIITLFVGLRAKMYYIEVEGKDFMKKIKGLQKEITDNTIQGYHFMNSLRNYEIISRDQYKITSKNHKIFTEKYHKIALNPFDDKRCLKKDSTDTLPWGHRDTVPYQS